MKPLSEIKRINQFLQNEFVSQRISAVKRAYIQAKLSISKLTRPKGNNQPTTSCSKVPKNHYRKTYATTRRFKTSLSHKRLYIQAKLSISKLTRPKGNKPTNNFSLENANEWNHYRNTSEENRLLRNEFVSQRISAVKRASLKAKLSIATNLANWKQPTNDFSLETANDWNHYRK